MTETEVQYFYTLRGMLDSYLEVLTEKYKGSVVKINYLGNKEYTVRECYMDSGVIMVSLVSPNSFISCVRYDEISW